MEILVLSPAEIEMVKMMRQEEEIMKTEHNSISSTEQAVRDIHKLKEYLESMKHEIIDPVNQIINLHANQKKTIEGYLSTSSLKDAVDILIKQAHKASSDGGWWNDPVTGEDLRGKRNIPELLMLIVSEIAEAMEGYRKDLMDDKLMHHKMITVELADALLRIGDLAGSMGLPVGKATEEKRNFNLTREDHKKEQRLKMGGKKF